MVNLNNIRALILRPFRGTEYILFLTHITDLTEPEFLPSLLMLDVKSPAPGPSNSAVDRAGALLREMIPG
jgi:hypothetical protein